MVPVNTHGFRLYTILWYTYGMGGWLQTLSITIDLPLSPSPQTQMSHWQLSNICTGTGTWTTLDFSAIENHCKKVVILFYIFRGTFGTSMFGSVQKAVGERCGRTLRIFTLISKADDKHSKTRLNTLNVNDFFFQPTIYWLYALWSQAYFIYHVSS